MCPRAEILRLLGEVKLPAEWEWVDGSMERQLPDATIVIAQGSALLEAAAFGVPFVSMRSLLSLTHNPLALWEEKYPECANISEDELFAIVTKLTSDHTIRKRLEILAREIREGFGDLDDECFSAFIRPEADKN